jgi:PAS domain S-box-containing protein/putative nucleotidyltransferase with HDIG domain
MAGSPETVLPHNSLQKATESFTEATATEKKESGKAAGPRTLELEFKHKNGSTVWLNTTVSFIRGTDGQPVEILGVLRDVTERRNTERALRKSEERLRHLIETTSDWVWEIDGKGIYTYVSPRIIQILGYEPEEVLGKTPFDLMPLQEANRMAKLLGSAIASGKSFTFIENTNLHKDGHSVVVETSGVPFLDEDGVVRGYRGIARDITERKQAEEQLHQSFYNLEKTLEGTIQAITLMVETRDRYTAGHQQRVTHLACTIAREMGLSSKQIQTIRIAGLLHDLGKIFIPTEILSKPGRLTDIEFAIIKTHPKAGYDILKNIDFPWPIADIVVQHHERMNGSGYPSGLQGEEITLEARILAVSDVIEAMASHRPYRPSLGLDRALKEVIDNKGVLYDSDVVDACLRVFVEKRFKLGEELATSSVG